LREVPICKRLVPKLAPNWRIFFTTAYVCHVMIPCQVSWILGDFWIYGDLKTKILLMKCFQITHGSLTEVVCPPTRGWCPPRCTHDLSRAFWLVRTQTPRIIRVHCWMLPDRTATLSPFDSTCSTWVSTMCMRRVAHASFSTRFSFKIGYHFSPLLSSVSRLFSQICMM